MLAAVIQNKLSEKVWMKLPFSFYFNTKTTMIYTNVISQCILVSTDCCKSSFAHCQFKAHNSCVSFYVLAFFYIYFKFLL